MVNKWAPGACRAGPSSPSSSQVGNEHGKEVAFLGVDANDTDPAAKKFLAARPLPYPSYNDPGRGHLADASRHRRTRRSTVFVDANGKTAYIH